MLRNRLITALTFNHGVLFRTKLFQPDYRYTANFIDAWSIDEIILLDITRPEEREVGVFEQVIESFAKKSFVPLCAGGGIKSTSDAKRFLDSGADKISVNTILHDDPNEVKSIISKFGQQCVVGSIDVKIKDNKYKVWKNCGREETDHNAGDFAAYLEEIGCGEIFVTSIDRDGSLEGYENGLSLEVTSSTNLPVILCGGAGKWNDFLDGFNLGKASAVATTNIYHFTEKSIQSAKQYLRKNNILVRI